MKLYFKRSNDELIYVDDCSTRVEMFEKMNNFLSQYNYTPPYVRMWRTGENQEKVQLDVGSWSEFFIVEDNEHIIEI